jgi:ATP diphosphatase
MLRATKLKFELLRGRRARSKERGSRPQQGSLAEMDALWDAIKAAEKANSRDLTLGRHGYVARN